MHNEMLQVEGKKMSKSLGNFFTVRDLLAQGVPGEVIRFVMLSTHYRKPMDWTEKKREEAEKTLSRWYILASGDVPDIPPPHEMLSALSDDLNTKLALDVIRRASGNEDMPTVKAGMRLLGLLEDGMGDWTKSRLITESDGDQFEIGKILQAWFEARDRKDYQLADKIRDRADEIGILLQIDSNREPKVVFKSLGLGQKEFSRRLKVVLEGLL